MKQISNFDQITSKFEDRTQKSFFLRHYEENSISETISKQILHLVYNFAFMQQIELVRCNDLQDG